MGEPRVEQVAADPTEFCARKSRPAHPHLHDHFRGHRANTRSAPAVCYSVPGSDSALERVTKLYQEAWALRGLARHSDMLPVRDQLLDLAARHEKLAKWLEENAPGSDLRRTNFSVIFTDLPALHHRP